MTTTTTTATIYRPVDIKGADSDETAFYADIHDGDSDGVRDELIDSLGPFATEDEAVTAVTASGWTPVSGWENTMHGLFAEVTR